MRYAAVFPGQGSQSVGMGVALAASSESARELFARAERVLGFDLLAVMRDGPEETLRSTEYAQPAIYVAGYALALASGLPFVASAGHSFAELASLTLANALDFESALVVVRERGLAMAEAARAVPGAMAAILGLEVEPLRDAVGRAREFGRVGLANFNSPAQIVISGDRAAVERAGELAKAAGAKRVVPLNVSGAWHSELMRSARERYAPVVEAAPIRVPSFLVISNVDAKPYGDVATIRRNLVRSVTDEVRWHDTAVRLAAEPLDAIVEFGGSSVLAPLFRRIPGAPPAHFASDPASLAALVPAGGAA